MNVTIDAHTYYIEELTLIENIKGTVTPAERFVFNAPVQEPGANDNATGMGKLAEMAVTAAKLVQQQKISPPGTITFLWCDEIVSTARYKKMIRLERNELNGPEP